MKEYTDVQVISLIANFPAGPEPKTREELIAKGSLINEIATLKSGEGGYDYSKIIGDIIKLQENEALYSVSTANKILGLKFNYLSDYIDLEMLFINHKQYAEELISMLESKKVKTK